MSKLHIVGNHVSRLIYVWCFLFQSEEGQGILRYMKVQRKQKYKQNISKIKHVSIKALTFIIYFFVTLLLSQSADLTVSVCIQSK